MDWKLLVAGLACAVAVREFVRRRRVERRLAQSQKRVQLWIDEARWACGQIELEERKHGR